jgi:hypothetical protein
MQENHNAHNEKHRMKSMRNLSDLSYVFLHVLRGLRGSLALSVVYLVFVVVPMFGQGAPTLRVQRDTARGQFGLKAAGIVLADALPVLEQATGCTIRADEKIAEMPLDCDLSLRSPDRLFLGVARQIGAKFRLSYQFRPLRRGEMERILRSAFVGQIVSFKPQDERQTVQEIGRRLGLEFVTEGGLTGTVRVRSVDRPLVRILDSIASQLRARWDVVITLEETDRHNLGSDALSYDTIQRHFSELIRLSPEDRRLEISARVDALRNLDGDARSQTLQRLEADIAGISQLYQGVPGEHRDDVRHLFFTLGQQYYGAFARLPDAASPFYRSTFEKLDELERLLGSRQ